ncbi:hypothetical protein CARUB_v10024333mg [Capsella rubella]|uniref:RING-type domain-containing protein n=1 Tax=Capsella rubella TaxID=81985 RepID=R0HEU5_9BRAS|nr:uncharacterized protein LOC17887724 [Capsella rubella]EOA28144.1 hypothetical protein CARUB_v10024333mg [Capsella rubella]
MTEPVIDNKCSKCLSDSSPLVVARACDHKFCVNCIIILWSRQKLTEPCVCPVDGEKIVRLGLPMIHTAEEIWALVDVYNPLFNQKHVPGIAERQLERFLTRMYCVHVALIAMGAMAYYMKKG